MINESELKKIISEGCKSHLYFLFGDDPYLIKTYSDLISKKVVPNMEELDLVFLDYNTSVSIIEENILQFSFLGNRKCVIVSNFYFDKLSISDFKKLKTLISNAPKNNCLVFYFDALELDLKKSSKLKDLIKIIEDNKGVVAELNHRTEMQLVKLLTDGALKRGCTLSNENAKFLIKYCSSDLSILVNELNKLCIYVKNSEISKEHIKELCHQSIEASIYNISKFILTKNLEKAFEEINNLLTEKIEVYYIYSEICSCFLDIYYSKIANENNIPFDKAAEDFDYKKNMVFRLRNSLRYAQNLNYKKIYNILNLLIDADSEIKTSNSSVYLEKLIINITLNL